MDGGVIASIVILALLWTIVVVTASYISRRLNIDTAVVIIIGILFWPAWLIMLLIAVGKKNDAAVNATLVRVGGVSSPSSSDDATAQYPSLSDTNLRSVEATA